MKPQNQPQSHHPSLQIQTPTYSILRLILITIRLLLIGIIMCGVILFQQYVRPRVVIPFIRRYLSCVVNLFFIRIVLLLMGFFKFECQNYRYFDKMSRTMTYKSGWVGVANNKNIAQFLYFSYLFNPTYARIVEYHEEISNLQGNNVKVFYTPLTFKEAFFASFNYRGFEPIVLKGEQELKRFKRRKMQMQTLVSECFEELNGPIMIFLPCLGTKQQLETHKAIGQDIYDNQKKFLRSGIAFISQIEQSDPSSNGTARTLPEFSTKLHQNQLTFLTQICSQLKINILTVTATQMMKQKQFYWRQTYAKYIDQLYNSAGYKIIKLGYSAYLNQLDCIDEEINKKSQRTEEKESGVIKIQIGQPKGQESAVMKQPQEQRAQIDYIHYNKLD